MRCLILTIFDVQKKNVGKKSVDYPLKFFLLTLVGAKQLYWNKHIKIVLKRELTFFTLQCLNQLLHVHFAKLVLDYKSQIKKFFLMLGTG